jgi:hypothetical protein
MSSAPTALNLAAIRSMVAIPIDLDPKSELFALLTQANDRIVALGGLIDARDQRIAARDQRIAARETEIAELAAQLRGRQPSRWLFAIIVVVLSTLAAWMGYGMWKAGGELAELRKQGINAFSQELEAAKKEAFESGYSQANADAVAEELAAAEDLARATYCYTDESPMLDMSDGTFAVYCNGVDGARVRFCAPPANAQDLDVLASYCQDGTINKVAGNCIDDNSPMSGDLGGGVFGLACTDGDGDMHVMFCAPPADAQELDTKADYCVAATF